jgi:hypothetical protein
MFSKDHVSDNVYEYLTDALTAVERAAVERHLQQCDRCSKERAKVERAMKMLNAEASEPPGLSESYWENYWRSLEPRLAETPGPFSRMKGFVERTAEAIRPVLFSPRFAYGFIGFTLGAVVMLAILSPYLGRREQAGVTTVQEIPPRSTESASLSSAAEELTQPLLRFFQKAKAFLIAVKNLDESREPANNLSAQVETSRRLAEECRSLQHQVLDPREQQLLNELDIVLVQLSKVQDESDFPKLEVVREGIEKNNLVMRIRVHELAQEVRLLQASESESKAKRSF